MELSVFLNQYGVTQSKLAEMINVKQSAISCYVKGKKIPGKEVMKRIYSITNGKVEPNDFYNLNTKGKSKQLLERIRLSKYLNKYHITQSKLALLLNVNQSSISHYVKGKKIPRKEIVERIYSITNGMVTPNNLYKLDVGKNNSSHSQQMSLF